MGLPNSYVLNIGKVGDYFDAIANAEAPERFTHKFLEGLGFSSSNDRLLIGLLKDLGFLDQDAVPQDRYFAYLDRSRSEAVLAEAVREAYSDLFAVQTTAHEMSTSQVENKLRTLYAGKKGDLTIKRIAKTFDALTKIADFERIGEISEESEDEEPDEAEPEDKGEGAGDVKRLSVRGLQYHINIVLPESRDQSVYDAIFRSLREHLG